MPGGPAEFSLFADLHIEALFAPDRADPRPGANSYDILAQIISKRFPGCTVRLVAFSLGARPALEIAQRLGSRVSSIDLVAPAAPFTSRDRQMAGYWVFQAARRSPTLFKALVAVQAKLASFAPSLLYAGLFKTAQGGDLALSQDTEFRERVTMMLVRCFGDGGQTYGDEVRAYVAPWMLLLAKVTQPVTLWHGTLDNWAPIAMSERLLSQLPNAVMLHRLEGLSHYSALNVALRAICSDAVSGGGVDNA